jgi:hypothetical protein
MTHIKPARPVGGVVLHIRYQSTDTTAAPTFASLAEQFERPADAWSVEKLEESLARLPMA